jgi:membrane protease YdiL (CAAX protease family)
MTNRAKQTETLLKATGIGSPYLAVIAGVFLLKNAFFAILFYHLVLLSVIIIIKKRLLIRPFLKGFNFILGPLLCLGSILPGVVILTGWPIAHREGIELSAIFSTLNLGQGFYMAFAVYACLVNPFLEESFWRGCFDNRAVGPNTIDMLFAGYHALAVFPILKIPYVFLVFAAMFFVGWLFRTIYRLTGGLLIPLLMHIIADIAILCAVGMILR